MTIPSTRPRRRRRVASPRRERVAAAVTCALLAACGDPDWSYEPAHLAPLPPGGTSGPPVQVLLPGFEVDALPVELPNIDNVRYRADGTLVALGYDGNVWLLHDRDGDGLEESAEKFLDEPLTRPVGLDVTPEGYPHGEGVLVTSVGKVSLLLDTDGNDRADREVVVASGWEPPWNAGGGTDAFGAAFGPDGSVYFGVGTTDFSNPYLLRRGTSLFDLGSLRGAIHRATPPSSGDLDEPWTLETMGTGIRFSVGLALNAEGDLFCTDQEGSTWIENGNPYDELIHVEKGRHHGFPPRHPQYLPGVYDDASLYDYGPQHQCACGLTFDGAHPDGRRFGPAHWLGSAFVCGFSRGRLFRTQLAKTRFGYVAQNATWAVADLLPVDQCISPRGDLVVACHGGEPDWGTGPSGTGTLLRIRYADRARPQPVLAWASGPREVSIAFDRPLDAAPDPAWTDAVEITFGDYVRAGDRYETKKPGYQARLEQHDSTRFRLPVASARLTADRRTIVLATERHPSFRAATPRTPAAHALDWFALRFPAPDLAGGAAVGRTVELDYTAAGVEARWTPDGGESDAARRLWLPHLDLDAARTLTRGSAAHDELFARLQLPGTLTLATQLDLDPGRHALAIEGPSSFRVRAGGEEHEARGSAQLALTSDGSPLAVEIALRTGSEQLPALHVGYVPAGAPGPRALPLEKLLLPWVEIGPRPPEPPPRPVRQPSAAGFTVGRDLFRAHCATCHFHRGIGNAAGPNLDNLVHRDRASVRRDIVEPSAVINPDYVTYAVQLENGMQHVGFVTRDGDDVIVTDIRGGARRVPAARVASMQVSPLSTMPDTFATLLAAPDLDRLLDHLLFDPTSCGRLPEHRADWPAARTAGELERLVPGAGAGGGHRPLRVLLIGDAAGATSAGGGVREFFTWQKAWGELLRGAPDVTVVMPLANSGAFATKNIDVAVCYRDNSTVPDGTLEGFERILAQGGGLVLVDVAIRNPRLRPLAGLVLEPAAPLPAEPTTLVLEPAAEARGHPILDGLALDGAELRDGLLAPLAGDPSSVQVLVRARPDTAAPQPVVWTKRAGAGRVAVIAAGRCSWTFNDPVFRALVFRAMAWAAGAPPARFDAVLPVGADLLR